MKRNSISQNSKLITSSFAKQLVDVKNYNKKGVLNQEHNSNNISHSSNTQMWASRISKLPNVTTKSRKGETENKTSESNNDSFLNRATLKEMVENVSPEQKVLNLIEDTLELFSDKHVQTDYLTEKERYESIEKNLLEKLKSDNILYKKENTKKQENLNELNAQYSTLKNYLESITNKYNKGEKDKTNNVNNIHQMQEKLNELLISNRKFTSMIEKEKVEKDNLFRVLVRFGKEKKKLLPESLKDIYKKFDSEGYKSAYDYSSQDRIETLKLRLENLEKTLITKKEELKKKKIQLNKEGIYRKEDK
jgi:hypothetical protein